MPVADLRPPVDHRRCADPAIGPDRHLGANRRVRADRRPSTDPGRRMDDRRGVDLGLVGNEAEQQLALGDDLIVQVRRRLRTRERGSAPAERNLQPQPIARHDLAAELRVVDAAQVHPRVGRPVLALHQQNRGRLRPAIRA